MKWGLVAVFVLVQSVVANAELVESYPERVVDRPLVLLPGMTELDVAYERDSTDRTLNYSESEVAVAHAFGPVELAADVARYATFVVALATHNYPERVEVFGLSGVPQKNDSLHVAQGAQAAQRFHLVPGMLALVVSAGFTVAENRYRAPATNLAWSNVLALQASTALEMQLLPTLVASASVSGGTPVTNTGEVAYSSAASAGVGLSVTIGSWDIFAGGGVGDVTEFRQPYLRAGFEKRWGGEKSPPPSPLAADIAALPPAPPVASAPRSCPTQDLGGVGDSISLFGAVCDDEGTLLPDVKVIIAGPVRGQTRTVTSNDRGLYSVESLPPGNYELTAYAGDCGVMKRAHVDADPYDRRINLVVLRRC